MATLQAWPRQHRLPWGFVLIAAFSLLRAIQTWLWRQRFGSLDFQESLPFALFLLFWFAIMSIGLIGGGIVWLTGTTWRELGWRRWGWLKAVGLGLVGFVLLYVNIIAWAVVKGETGQPALVTPSLGRSGLVAFFAFGLPAWVEENLYRGYLQPLLADRMRLWLAILAQAAVFSIAHLGYLSNPLDFGSTFVAGVILGWLRKRDASLVGPYTAHGLFWMLGAFMPPAAS